MAWIYLIMAGLLETIWATGLKSAAVSASLGRIAFVASTMLSSLVLLGLAMKQLPLGIAYPIWTGVGSVGALVLGIVLFGETAGWRSALGVSFLVVGMVFISMDTAS